MEANKRSRKLGDAAREGYFEREREMTAFASHGPGVKGRDRTGIDSGVLYPRVGKRFAVWTYSNIAQPGSRSILFGHSSGRRRACDSN